MLALFDIDTDRRREIELRRARDFARAVQDGQPKPLLVLDDQLRVISANQAFREAFAALDEKTDGRDVFSLAGGGLDMGRVRDRLEPLLRSGDPFDDVPIDLGGSGRSRALRFSGRRIVAGEGSFLLLTIGDGGERRGGGE